MTTPPRHQHPGDKKKTLEVLMANGERCQVHLDPRRDGVSMPAEFMASKMFSTYLELGYNLPTPTNDFTSDHVGFEITMLFGGRKHLTVVPWHAMYAITVPPSRSWIWSESAPPEWQRFAPAAPAAPPPPARASGAGVIDLMSRRHPAEQIACAARLRGRL